MNDIQNKINEIYKEMENKLRVRKEDMVSTADNIFRRP